MFTKNVFKNQPLKHFLGYCKEYYFIVGKRREENKDISGSNVLQSESFKDYFQSKETTSRVALHVILDFEFFDMEQKKSR
jgi:hypothetical protein